MDRCRRWKYGPKITRNEQVSAVQRPDAPEHICMSRVERREVSWMVQPIQRCSGVDMPTLPCYDAGRRQRPKVPIQRSTNDERKSYCDTPVHVHTLFLKRYPCITHDALVSSRRINKHRKIPIVLYSIAKHCWRVCALITVPFFHRSVCLHHARKFEDV